MNFRDLISNIRQGWRFYLILLVFFSTSLIVMGRFYDLQVLQREQFKVRAANQVNSKKDEQQRKRGKIYFQEKKGGLVPVAINKDFYRIFSVPEEIEDAEKTAKVLTNILEVDQSELVRKFSKPNDLFELLAKKADKSLVNEVRDLDIAGIYIDKTTHRFYPHGELASQVLGFVRDDPNNFRGQYGLEKYYDSYLGKSKEGGFLGLLSLREFIFNRGNYDIVSTVDFNIQKKAEYLLSEAVEEQEAESGSLVVLEPKTGKVLALANYPNFDPNNYFKYSLSSFTNPTIQSIYEPGSTFKVLTVAAGLEGEKITPDTLYEDTGLIEVDGRKIRNWDLKSHGFQTVTDVLAKSLNTGVVFIEKLLGHDFFYQFILNTDIHRKTGIDLPGEVAGNIRNLKGFQEVYFATASFGQGVSVTPIGLLSALSSVANDGVMMKPYIVDKIVDSQTNKEKIFSSKEEGTLISKENSQLVSEMLTKAVEENFVAKIEGYNIAGKTGTAQVPDETGSYSSEDTIHSFFGFAPSDDPRFTVLVKIDKPRKDKFAGATAVPVFRKLTKYMLEYYEIAPE